LFNGRPLSINYFSQNIPTIFECWYLGQETGHAIAEVLFGDYNPGGKLPITIPRSVGHLPAYYNYKPAARRGYLFDEVSPLYPFGYGLSYTTFLISKPELTSNRITKDETTTLQLKVKNAGTIAGGEVVQLYIRDKVSSVTRPIKELKGFQRINLDPGEEQTVEFEISPALLMFWNIDMEYTVEPGEFDLLVGNSSRDEDLQQICLQVTE
jgi:beta-glucosidase